MQTLHFHRRVGVIALGMIVGVITLTIKLHSSLRQIPEGQVLYPTQNSRTEHGKNKESSQNKNISKIVIYTSSRTGSSFTGEFFKQNPHAHYLFEPFKLISLNRSSYLERDYLQGKLGSYLSDALNCDYKKLFQDSYKTYPSNDAVRTQWTKRIFEQTFDRGGQNLSRSFLKEACEKYNIRVLKIIRSYHLHNVLPLIMDEDVMILNLIRDPRAKAISRVEIDAQKAKMSLREFVEDEKQSKALLNIAKVECELLHDSLAVLNRIKGSVHEEKITKYFQIVRYEDIALDPIEMYKKIYEFLRLSESLEVTEWIWKSTKTDQGDLFGTSRNSEAVVEKWRTKLPLSLILKMQEECGYVLNMFGYKMVRTESELTNLNNSLISTPNSSVGFRLS